jgi:prepilin-type N-terminal cleavage/methylation domain-containing protein
MNYRKHHRPLANGFTFIEALVTIAILSVMAALLVSAFSNAAADTNRIVARQQQVAVQQAVNAWVSGESNRVTVINATTGSAKIKTLEEIRTEYNQVLTSLARFNMISGYLDSTIVSQMTDTTVTTNTGKIKSNALISTKQHLEMPTWASGDFPQVNLVND